MRLLPLTFVLSLAAACPGGSREVCVSACPDEPVDVYILCLGACHERCSGVPRRLVEEAKAKRRRLLNQGQLQGQCLTQQVLTMQQDLAGLSELQARVAALENIVGTLSDPAACDGLANVALNKVATQVSDHDGNSQAHQAVDGDTNNDWNRGSDRTISHTGNNLDSWWSVDLAGTFRVNQVLIYNAHEHCCLERIVPFEMFFCSDEPCLRTSPQNIIETRRFDQVEEIYDITGLQVRGVKFFSVQLDKTDYLHLAEVEIFGCPDAAGDADTLGQRLVAIEATLAQLTLPAAKCTPSNLSQGQPATQSSNYGATSPASEAVDGDTNNVWNKMNEGSITHTNSEKDAWWQVDIGAPGKHVTEIVVYNAHEHCCQDRIVPFDVLLCDSLDCKRGRSSVVGTYRFTQTQAVYTISGIAVDNVRAVTVQIDKTDYLHLAEVQVFGC